MKNPVNWFEIAATDIERAKTFYTAVFGSQFQQIDMPGATLAMFAGDPTQPNAMGALVKGKDVKPSVDGVTIYFQSEDVAIEEAKVEGAGGKVIMPKTSIGEFGNIAMFIDTEGNRIGLHSH